MEEQDREIKQKLQFIRLSWRVEKGLCLECGSAKDVIRALCTICRQLPRNQELLRMEMTFVAKYYLVIGNENRGHKLCDCQSDQIELAEHQAVEVLKKLRERGNEDAIVRVVEESTRLVVFAVHKGNVGNL